MFQPYFFPRKCLWLYSSNVCSSLIYRHVTTFSSRRLTLLCCHVDKHSRSTNSDTVAVKMVKQSHYRPGVAQSVPQEVNALQISWQRHRMVVGCQPYAPAAFTLQEILLVLISVTGWADPPRAIVRSEGFYINEKFPLTPAGIELATIRFVAQHNVAGTRTKLWS